MLNDIVRPLVCPNCLNANPRHAVFCAACGRQIRASQSSDGSSLNARSHDRAPRRLVPWIVLIVAAIVALASTDHDRRDDCSTRQKNAGLVIDLPPDYPADFFTRQAVPRRWQFDEQGDDNDSR